MDLWKIGIGGLWTGLFAASLGMLFTAQARYLVGIFFCATAGRLARDVLMGRGMNPNWATVVAAAVVVLVAAAVIRGPVVSLVALMSAIIPLGAAISMFETIVGLMRVSILKGDALSAASVALTASMARTFMIFLSIALGMGAGLAIVRFVRREANRE